MAGIDLSYIYTYTMNNYKLHDSVRFLFTINSSLMLRMHTCWEVHPLVRQEYLFYDPVKM